MKINDKQMREFFYLKYPDAVTIEEVKFPEFRGDIIEFRYNKGVPVIIGYEIKSDYDSLYRLEQQLQGYLRYCNYVFVLVTERHLGGVMRLTERDEMYSGVGVQVLKDGQMECVQTAKYQNLRDAGLNTDWITANNNLFQWEYLLNEVWGCDI